MASALRTLAPVIALAVVGGLFLLLGMPLTQVGMILLGLVLIALPAWFPTWLVRIVGATLLAAVAMLFLRIATQTLFPADAPAWQPFALALVAAALLGGLAWRFVPQRVLRRFSVMIPSMVLLVYVTTLLMYSAPGSPFAEEKQASAHVIAAKRAAWGVPESPTEFFWSYMGKVVSDFDFGPSLKVQGRSVMELLGPAFPVSMSLGLTALVMAAALGLLLGIRAGLRPNSLADYSSMSLAVIGISLPNFVIGALLLIVFSLGMGWLPVAGWGSYKHLLLPAFTLALPYAAYIARLSRAGTIEVMQQDFIRTARAKGLSEREIVFKHALKGAILPVVSFLGPAAAGIMTGSFVVETLFGIPGMGHWFVKGAINRDYSVVLGTALIYFSIVIAFNLLVDLAYAWLDPRVREEL